MIRERMGVRGGVRIDITKRIPSGAGLGGGSADAAAVVLSLPRLWGGELPPEALREIALRLGSDVPYFLGEGTASGGGRGEVLEYFPLAIPFAVLVSTPPVRVSTRWAYGEIVPRPAPGEDLRSLVVRGMEDPSLLRRGLVNDFETPVFREHPLIRSLKESMIRSGALFASLSGSGSSVYGFFVDEPGAAGAARAPEMSACRTFITPPNFRV
jgi:4-diphosphocytidyl-2-C-methyl-D-erythritol kinase